MELQWNNTWKTRWTAYNESVNVYITHENLLHKVAHICATVKHKCATVKQTEMHILKCFLLEVTSAEYFVLARHRPHVNDSQQWVKSICRDLSWPTINATYGCWAASFVHVSVWCDSEQLSAWDWDMMQHALKFQNPKYAVEILSNGERNMWIFCGKLVRLFC